MRSLLWQRAQSLSPLRLRFPLLPPLRSRQLFPLQRPSQPLLLLPLPDLSLRRKAPLRGPLFVPLSVPASGLPGTRLPQPERPGPSLPLTPLSERPGLPLPGLKPLSGLPSGLPSG